MFLTLLIALLFEFVSCSWSGHRLMAMETREGPKKLNVLYGRGECNVEYTAPVNKCYLEPVTQCYTKLTCICDQHGTKQFVAEFFAKDDRKCENGMISTNSMAVGAECKEHTTIDCGRNELVYFEKVTEAEWDTNCKRQYPSGCSH